MINNAIENLFTTIENSKEYKEYQAIVKILDGNKEVKELIAEIKSLQQESVNLEYQKDSKYQEIDKEIEQKVTLLNNNKDYQEYLKRLKEFNYALNASSALIEDYISDVV